MRTVSILILLAAGCGPPEKSIQQQVFDDYLLLHFYSWSDAKGRTYGRTYVPEFYYKTGDSLRLDSELNVLIVPSDTATRIPLGVDNALRLDSGTLIQFISDEHTSADFGPSIEIKANVGDTTYRGIADTEEILAAELGPEHLSYARTRLLQELSRLKKEGLTELSKKYELSEDSILTLIVDEFFVRTGRRGINY